MSDYYYDYYSEDKDLEEYQEDNSAPVAQAPLPSPPPANDTPKSVTRTVPNSFEVKPIKPVPADAFPSLSQGATPAPKPTTNGDIHAHDEDLYKHDIAESFDDMSLKDALARGIYSYGFEKPSAIQQRAIIPCIKGTDIIAQAQSGTGKTATFAISILQRVDVSKMHVQAMILAPTRELAQQIQKVTQFVLFVHTNNYSPFRLL